MEEHTLLHLELQFVIIHSGIMLATQNSTEGLFHDMFGDGQILDKWECLVSIIMMYR
jgi:hypothetical protein